MALNVQKYARCVEKKPAIRISNYMQPFLEKTKQSQSVQARRMKTNTLWEVFKVME